MKDQDHPDHDIDIGKNTEKSSADPRKLAVTQTAVKNQKRTLAWKTRKS